MHRHCTATTFIISKRRQTLLLWHRRLQRWMPPGGHLEPHETPDEAALRECKEETGLDIDLIIDPQEDLFQGHPEEGCMLPRPHAILLENIPPCPTRNEPAHQHIDFVFLARPKHGIDAQDLPACEGTTLRWFSRDEVEKLDKTSEIFSNVQRFLLQWM